MSRLLVTGGCGFVGVPLVRHAVERGDDVVVFDDFSRGSREALGETLGSVRLVEGDVRHTHLVRRTCGDEGVEAIVHLAALHFIPACNADPERCLSINTTGTRSVLEGAVSSGGVRAFVLASTAAVYGPSDDAHLESERPEPTDVYGRSKLAAEQLAARVRDREGLPVSAARLFNVFGPGETNPHLIPEIAAQALNGGKLRLGNLSTARDYVYTDDVARGILALADATLDGRSIVCNLGTGVARTGTDVVRAVSKIVEKNLVVATEAGRVRTSDRPMLRANVDRAEQELSWRPRVSFEEGLRAALSRPLQ